ncbi:MAG TPA: multiheme c-type cytochrome [Polyangiaceae bacterium]|nr:multiheme c-type cytochrome [Polyangiaceae bacterium]
MSRPLQKRRGLLEHQAPWLILSVLCALASAGIVVAIDSGALADYALFPAILRGYTLTGLFFGVSSVGLALLTFLYSLRKRSLQEKMPVGTMAGWLWGHVYLGLLCLLLAIAHAGYGTIGLELTLGKTLLLLLLLLVVSGLIWRVVYAVVPARAANEVGHYSQAASRTRAATAQVEIEKLSAGRSPALQQMVDWLQRVNASDAEVAHVARTIAAEDQAVVPDLVRLTRMRHQMLQREARQGSYRRKLQWLRLLHVPVSLLFLLLLPLHVLWALDVPPKLAASGAALGSTLGAYHGSEACSSCHERIVSEWRTSMHAHALTSPIMVAQGNLALRETLANTSTPDPQNVCVNCHGPIATALSPSPVLPFKAEGALAEPALASEGVSCSVCHQWQGESQTAGGGLTAFQKGLVPGHTFFGPYDDAVGNAFHRSQATTLFKQPTELCRNCHSVQYDRNGDGKIERGTDLVLQTLYDEWADFAKKGGPTCVDCHMPVVKGSRAAESALIPLEQDGDAPARVLRSHRFVAVDYPLDKPAVRDESRSEREGLLQRAGLLSIVDSSLNVTDTRVSFDVSLQNTGTGHNLPGGFAFVRQMWLEVSLLNTQGQTLAVSGRLAKPSDDLCDASLVDDTSNPLRGFVVGCPTSDRQLVNFQQQLFDKIELLRDSSGAVQLDSRGQAKLRAAPGAVEVVVQHLTSGPAPRVRPATGKPTPPLLVGEQRSFPYVFDLPSSSGASTLRVRLLFRAVPPYFLRALAKTQTPADGQNLAELVQNLEINEMARVEAPLLRRN